MIVLFSLFSNIIFYSSIMYILPCILFYFLHNFNWRIFFFTLSSFYHMQPNLLSQEIVYLISSGVWPCRNYCVVFDCLFSFTSLAAYYFYHSQTPFQNQTDWIGNSFEIIFPRINLNFSNQLEKLPRIYSTCLNQLEKLPWINSN